MESEEEAVVEKRRSVCGKQEGKGNGERVREEHKKREKGKMDIESGEKGV